MDTSSNRRAGSERRIAERRSGLDRRRNGGPDLGRRVADRRGAQRRMADRRAQPVG